MCGEDKKLIDSHHLIPIWCGGMEEDIIQVCRGCHTKLESKFKNLIFYGDFNKPEPYSDRNKINEAKKRSYQKHHDEIRKKIKDDRKDNPEKYRGPQREWNRIHKEHISIRAASWRVRTGRTKKSKILEKLS
jgi:hypothetical protein